MLTQPFQLLVDPLLAAGLHRALYQSSIWELCSRQEGVPGICCHSEKHHIDVIVMCSYFTQISLIVCVKLSGHAMQ